MPALTALSRCGLASRAFVSDVSAGFAMTLQIPARDESTLREKRMDAGLRLRGIENKLGLAIFLLHGVVTGHGDFAERLAIGRDAVAKYTIIHDEREQR